MMKSEQRSWKNGRGRRREAGQVVMNAWLFTAGRPQHGCVLACGSCGSGSFVRQTDLMASVWSHLQGGAERFRHS